MIPKTMRAGLFAAALVACASAGICAQDGAGKKRVAVLNFDSPIPTTGAPVGLFGAAGEDVGKGVSVLLIEKLVKGGKYIVVDRSALEVLLKEQKAEDTKDMDAYALAARIGRMVGLDAMIIGSVTQYDVEDQGKETKAHGLTAGGVVKTRKAKARVGITAQVFSVTTGQVMSSFVGKGESSETGDMTVFAGHGQTKTSLETLGSEFVNSLFPEATRTAVDQIAEQLNAYTGQIPELRLAIDGRVAEVNGTQLTLNVGRKNGVKVGEQLTILRDSPAAESTNPQGVAPLPQRIGAAAITEVSEDYSTATLQGSVEVKAGDRVRRVEPPDPAPK